MSKAEPIETTGQPIEKPEWRKKLAKNNYRNDRSDEFDWNKTRKTIKTTAYTIEITA